MEKWVVCHIFYKKRSKKSGDQEEINNINQVKKPHLEPKFIHFMKENGTSSSSSSSGITEVSSSGADDPNIEESSS